MGLAHIDVQPDPERGRVVLFLSLLDGGGYRLTPTRQEARDLALKLLRAADALPPEEKP